MLNTHRSCWLSWVSDLPHPLTHSLTHSFTHSVVHSFASFHVTLILSSFHVNFVLTSLIHQWIYSLIHLLADSWIELPFTSFIDLLIHWLIGSWFHWLIWFIYSLINALNLFVLACMHTWIHAFRQSISQSIILLFIHSFFIFQNIYIYISYIFIIVYTIVWIVIPCSFIPSWHWFPVIALASQQQLLIHRCTSQLDTSLTCCCFRFWWPSYRPLIT